MIDKEINTCNKNKSQHQEMYHGGNGVKPRRPFHTQRSSNTNGDRNSDGNRIQMTVIFSQRSHIPSKIIGITITQSTKIRSPRSRHAGAGDDVFEENVAGSDVGEEEILSDPSPSLR